MRTRTPGSVLLSLVLVVAGVPGPPGAVHAHSDWWGWEKVVAPATLSVGAKRIDYERDGLSGWYVNDVRGLEPGFRLSAPPTTTSEPLVTLDRAVSGGLTPQGSGGSNDGSPSRYIRDGNFFSASFGRSVASAGDVNGDGYDDVIIGEPAFDGLIWVYHGSPSGPNFDNYEFVASGGQAGARYGTAAASAGDVNGDGYDDVIVGAPYYDNGHTDEGRVWVYHGSPSGLIPYAAFRSDSDQANALYGYSVASAGDVNGDGYDDVIVGAPGYDNGHTNEGRVWVYHGSPSGLIPYAAFRSESNQADAWYGYSVATAGDVNGDGYDDVIVGAPRYDTPHVNEGRAWVYHGSSSGLIAFAAFRASDGWIDADFGISVASAGDVNGDGYDEVIVGIPNHDMNGPDCGRVVVFRGPL